MKILLNLKERQIDSDPLSESDKGRFYEAWPKTMETLEKLKFLINNSVAKFVIGLAIQVGDFVYERKK